MSEKKTVDKEDFDLTLQYNIFDIIYSVDKRNSDLTIKSWCVVGYELNSSSDKRCFDYSLISYPISVYIQANKRIRLGELSLSAFVNTSRRELLNEVREDIQSQFNSMLISLDANN